MSSPTLGHAFAAKGGHEGQIETGRKLRGPYTPSTPFIPNDPTLGTPAQLALRYVGANPTDLGEAERGIGEGEATLGTLPNLIRILREHSDLLDIDPAALPAVIADLEKGNSGTGYYDLNSVLVNGTLAVDWVDQQYARLYPAPPVQQPATPPPPQPVAPPSPPAPPTQPADPHVLTFHTGRFRASATFDAGERGHGNAQVVLGATDASGLFWFFAADNWECGVKVLDGRAVNGHWWVSDAGWTDVGVVVTVIDSQTGKTWTHKNPRGTLFQPKFDTVAFPA